MLELSIELSSQHHTMRAWVEA